MVAASLVVVKEAVDEDACLVTPGASVILTLDSSARQTHKRMGSSRCFA